MKRSALVVVLAVGCAAGLACRKPELPDAEAAAPWFADVTEAVGLDFVHDAGPVDGRYFLPQVMGSGAALFDCDGDGLLDVYLLHNGGPTGKKNQLFRQLPGGTFRDVSAGSGLDVAGHGMGVAVGDVNNDGLPDVLVTEYGRVRLFLNQGGGKFLDVTKEAGLDSPHWGTSTAFVDYDLDGWLDLVVVNYLDYDRSWRCGGAGGKPDYCHPNEFPGVVARLFRNKGGRAGAARVEFEDVTVPSGLGGLPGAGLGVACADFDGDGWPDILVANDAQPNRLWVNQLGKPGRKQGEPFFRDEAVLRGLAFNGLGQAQGNMGVALGDVDGDALIDVFITHLTEETHTFWKQGPAGHFQDRTAAAGLAGSRWRGTGFGTVLGDFDHDGAPDLVVVNGRVARFRAAEPERLGPHWACYAERNQVFVNEGRGRFRDVSAENRALCGPAGVYRGLAVGDVDGDGALDLLVTEVAGPARLYRNVAPGRGHWLLVRAVDPALRRDAYGAEVAVRAGNRRWVGWVNPGQSYLCSNDPRVHFGLGEAGRVDEVAVRWPDGTREVFAGGPADRAFELRKGGGKRGRR